MAESVLSLSLRKLGSFLVEEVGSLRGVEAKALWIKDELERISVFLKVADENAETNPQLKVWIQQVMNIAYDIEDTLDVFLLFMAQNYHQGDRSYGFIRKISWSIKKTVSRHKKAVSRHRLASSIQGIESKVREISNGQKHYNSMIMKVTSGQGSIAPANNREYNRADALSMKEVELVGFNKNIKQIIQWLVEDNNFEFRVISLVGMGGLGKTMLARKAYDADQVKDHFTHRAWVNVSQSFNVNMLLRDLIGQLIGEFPVLREMGRIKLINKIKHFLQKCSYIIVLDNVRKIEHWDAIKYAFPHNNFGSRVILTTHLDDVAKGASRGSRGEVLPFKPLSSKDSATLFCRKTFHEDIFPEDLKDIVEVILKRCEGLPAAIVAISGMLATKNRSRDEWEIVKDRLGDELEGNYMSQILLLSYYDLPYYLKSCFLYLSAFPEGYVINCKRLVRLWVAEGFVEAKEGRTLEEVGMNYLNQLASRSVIKVVKTDICDRRARECCIPDFIRNLILRMSKEQNFMTVVAGTNTAWPEEARRLSVLKTMRDEKEIKGIQKLRSLLMMEYSYSTIPKGVKLLRVLDLQRVGLTAVPNEMCNQYHLRYLSLRDNYRLNVLPNSIGRLVNLEVFDFRGSDVFKLPTTILELRRLRHLLGGIKYRKGFEAILGIGCLHDLQTLCWVDLEEQKEGIVEEFGKLKQIRKLGIYNLSEKDGPAFCSSLKNLDQLRNLSVTSKLYASETFDLKYLSSPPTYLQRLSLRGCTAQWIISLHNLIKLSLSWTRLQEDQFVCLQSLPNLVSLSLYRKSYVGETLCFKVASLKKLRLLEVNLESLKLLIIEEGALSSLEELSFTNCWRLEKVPLGIQKLTNLKSVTLRGPSEILIKSIDCSKGGEDYNKVKNIPTIHILDGVKYINLGREGE